MGSALLSGGTALLLLPLLLSSLLTAAAAILCCSIISSNTPSNLSKVLSKTLDQLLLPCWQWGWLLLHLLCRQCCCCCCAAACHPDGVPSNVLQSTLHPLLLSTSSLWLLRHASLLLNQLPCTKLKVC